MKDTRSAVGKPEDVDWSNYTSQGASAGEDEEKKALMEAERERELEEKKMRRERERKCKQAEKERKEEEKRRREEQKKNVEWAASTLGYIKEELAAMKHNIKFEERFNGMLENKREFDYDATPANDPSQVRFPYVSSDSINILRIVLDCYLHKPLRRQIERYCRRHEYCE